ncbi:MAG: redoxin domain-containing protein [Gaiellaceae bacterium MAG52_C11]|nr:redoxin domain-containing protein [Candidatus Gaiellasilicea maunaloa]
MRVFGVSRDSSFSHRAWKEALALETPLLSDWNGELTRRLGLARDWRGLADVPERAAILVDEDGTVRRTWRYADSEVPDFDALLVAVRAS